MAITKRRLKKLEEKFAIPTKYGIDVSSLPMSELLNGIEEGLMKFGLSAEEAKSKVEKLRNEPWGSYSETENGQVRYLTKPSEFTYLSDEELLDTIQGLAEKVGIKLNVENVKIC